MEAAVLKKKKSSISKGTIKKTIKNVICKPDPIRWPAISEEESRALETVLFKYHVELPQFKKPHWKQLKNIPKIERPKPPAIKKPDGFIFGLSECITSLENNEVAAIILEDAINPRTIAQTLLLASDKKKVPVVCLANLRTISAQNFGISTSFLGVKSNLLTDVTDKISQISVKYKAASMNEESKQKLSTLDEEQNVHNFGIENEANDKMDVDDISNIAPSFTYLYRTDKKRVFVPPKDEGASITSKQFLGQNFIELPKNVEQVKSTNNTFKKMIVKRIANNPNRAKKRK